MTGVNILHDAAYLQLPGIVQTTSAAPCLQHMRQVHSMRMKCNMGCQHGVVCSRRQTRCWADVRLQQVGKPKREHWIAVEQSLQHESMILHDVQHVTASKHCAGTAEAFACVTALHCMHVHTYVSSQDRSMHHQRNMLNRRKADLCILHL